MPRGRGVGVAKSLEIGHPSKNWNARFGQELLVCNKCGTWRYKSGSVPVPIGLLFLSHIVCYSYHGFAQLSDKIFAKKHSVC